MGPYSHFGRKPLQPLRTNRSAIFEVDCRYPEFLDVDYYHGNLRVPPPKLPPPQEIAGLIKGL